MKASKIIQRIESQAPLKIAESWDNPGLQLGKVNKDVKKVLTTIEITPDIIKEAIDGGFDMIVTHHPFLFRPLPRIDTGTTKGKMVEDLIKNDIIVYSAHTNLDKAENGLNRYIAELLGLKDIKPLLTDNSRNHYYKLTVFIPAGHEEEIIEALKETGYGGFDEKYENCSFTTEGTGRFTPLEGSNPYIGETGKGEKTPEVRFETVLREDQIPKALQILKKKHPYESFAYDLIELKNSDFPVRDGLGIIGKFEEKLSPEQVIDRIKERLELTKLRSAGKPVPVKKVAICTGAGSDLIKKAKNKKADLFITGDLKYHEAQTAVEEGLWVIDAGHFGTEYKVKDLLKDYLKDLDICVKASKNDKDFIDMI